MNTTTLDQIMDGLLSGNQSFPVSLGNLIPEHLANRHDNNRAKARILRMKHYLRLIGLMEKIGKSLHFLNSTIYYSGLTGPSIEGIDFIRFNWSLLSENILFNTRQ